MNIRFLFQSKAQDQCPGLRLGMQNNCDQYTLIAKKISPNPCSHVSIFIYFVNSCKVYDVSAIKVRDTDKGQVGKAVTFLVETSQAGMELNFNYSSIQ